MAKPILWIVIPCYNEEQVLPLTAPMFLQKLRDLAARGQISENSRVLFVNDGSADRTWEIILELSERMSTSLASARAGTGAIRTRCWPA